MASLYAYQAFKDFLQQSDLGEYPLDNILDWITSNLDPNDVFDESRLRTWAEDHGYVDHGYVEEL